MKRINSAAAKRGKQAVHRGHSIEEEVTENNDEEEEDEECEEDDVDMDESKEEEGDEVSEDGQEDFREKKKARFALPTKMEQLALQQTEVLMKTNLLRLQVDEMLSEVKCGNLFDRPLVSKWIDSLVQILNSAPEVLLKKMASSRKSAKSSSEHPIILSKKWLEGLGLPLIRLEGHNKETISMPFTKPRSVDIVGSSILQTATSPILNVDIIVGMPGDGFEERDILNHAYFDKRKLYLAAMAESLGQSMEIDCVSIVSFKGDWRKPALVLKPKPKKLRDIAVRIVLAVSFVKMLSMLSSLIHKVQLDLTFGTLIANHNTGPKFCIQSHSA